jgi:hypothetical protein
MELVTLLLDNLDHLDVVLLGVVVARLRVSFAWSRKAGLTLSVKF